MLGRFIVLGVLLFGLAKVQAAQRDLYCTSRSSGFKIYGVLTPQGGELSVVTYNYRQPQEHILQVDREGLFGSSTHWAWFTTATQPEGRKRFSIAIAKREFLNDRAGWRTVEIEVRPQGGASFSARRRVLALDCEMNTL